MRAALYRLSLAAPLGRNALIRGAGVVAGVALVGLISLVDHATGLLNHLELLYVVPIAVASWMSGRIGGLAVALAAAASWQFAQPAALASVVAIVLFILFVGLVGRLRESLDRSDERFNAAMEALVDPVYAEDKRTGELLYRNRCYTEMFGAAQPRFHAGGETQSPAGDRWFVLRSRPLAWRDGRDATLCVLSDVTEERRARELIAMHRDAAHRTARLIALGEFASAIAHELNQPLAAIATYNHSCMRMLQSGKLETEELQQAMHICRDQAKRAGKIIQRLRELLRQPGPAFAEQNLNELVAAVLALAEPEARDAGIRFERLLAATAPVVRADRLLIEQVALNLVRNAMEAVQALPGARRRITVATRVEPDGSGTLSVSDLGEGIAPDVEASLFLPFVTTKPGGLGLGLSICRSVVEAHGGSIRHERNPRASGAVFEVTLPGAA
ncbi:MAG: hypothetical protein EPO20_28065 [Betaproteobacteria bacterium]|nr:MAG: hypothetical protein EPO20_28065 [Betaproteobacteria bacterium]